MTDVPERVPVASSSMSAAVLETLQELIPGAIVDGVLDAQRIADLVALPSSMPPTMLGKAMLLPGLAKIGRDAAPRIVGKGRCQDIVWQGDDVHLTSLPVLKCWQRWLI